MQRQPQCSNGAFPRIVVGSYYESEQRPFVRCHRAIVPGMTMCSACLAQRFSQPRLSVVENRRG
jgi:hypothetical protein